MLFKHFEYPHRDFAAMSAFHSSTQKSQKKKNNNKVEETFNNWEEYKSHKLHLLGVRLSVNQSILSSVQAAWNGDS